MSEGRRDWREVLEIVDRTMRDISGITDPEDLVDRYWRGIGELIPGRGYVAVSRRGVEAPWYLVTRSSRFAVHPNPWLERERLPRLTGGVLGEMAYGGRPLIIEDLPSRLSADDPGRPYLEGYQTLLAFPQYDGGEALNSTGVLLEPGEEFDESIIPTMHWQNSLFGRGTRNLILRNQLSAALAALDAELQVVGDLQRSLLPESLPSVPGYELAAHYQASARAGGDYYDLFPVGAGGASGWGVLVADVSGHGTPAAVLMAIVRALVHTRADLHGDPPGLLGWLNAELARSYTAGRGAFVTAFYGVLEPGSGVVRFSSAGHLPPGLVRRGGRVEAGSSAGGLPLGIVGEERYGCAEARLGRGDTLLVYTDGVTEAMRPVGVGAGAGAGARELFGVERVDRAAGERADDSAEALVSHVCGAVDAFCAGGAATDDRTIVAVRRR